MNKQGCSTLIAIFIAICIGYYLFSGPEEDRPKATKKAQAVEQKIDSEGFISRIKAKLPKDSPWDYDVSKLKKSDVTLSLYYTKIPKGIDSVRRDTELVAKAILDVMIEDGVKPMQDWASVFVHAYKRIDEKSVTGQDQLLSFGRTHYDFNTDKLIWEPTKQ